jgi:hypothetical protein
MQLRARTGSLLLAVLVLTACQSDDAGSSESPSKHDPKGREATGEAGGKTPTSASDPTKDGNSKPGTAGSDAPGKADPANGDPSKAETMPPEPLKGDTDFSSADPTSTSGGGPGVSRGGVATSGAAGSAATTPPAAMTPTQDAANAGTPRTVERGDIYRVLDDHRILNLNGYRGLQVIDVSNVDAPRIEGRLAATGTPLEMYVVGQRAIVLMNDWQGYYGSRDDIQVEKVAGGLVLNVDISNRAAPKLLSQAVVKGSISTSRLTQGGGQAALYVAANVYQDMPPYTNTTLVKSFDVSGDAIAEKSEIDLGGYVQDVQATDANLLLVSSIDYNKAQQQSQVSVIDISRADGTMVRGGSVTVRGIVENKFNMDAYNGVLRVVSGSTWSGTRENHLETFSLDQLSAPRSLGHCAFAPGDSLFATIFIENKGFFVTYLRQDPFHAFSIDDQGRCEEHNEFIVSGWNDFLRPTLDGTRLVGVGSNDTSGRRTISISLYDTTNIDNPQPLLARADLALDNSYSEAQWDDRAFSVIEGAVNAQSSNGTAETGLILVPFQGYVQSEQRYVSQVQILTFSARTLTRRGVMDHGTAVRRSFLADTTTAANLSEEELRLYNIGNPDKPAAKGRVEVAPNYRQLFVYGDYVARVHDPSMYFGWYGNTNVTPPAAKVEIVPRSGDLEAAPIASFDVPSNATLVQANKLLLSITTVFDQTTANAKTVDEQKWNTHIDAFDLSDPAKPAKRGSLDTDRIRPYYGYYPYPGGPGPVIARGGVAIDCFDCGPYPYRGSPTQYVVGDAVVFVLTQSAQKSVGTVRRCYEYAVNSQPCAITAPTPGGSSGTKTPQTCSYISGNISCAQYEGQAESCSGGFYECPGDGSECKELDPKDVATQRNCYSGEEFRYWNVFGFDPLDIRDPDHLVLGDRVQMDKQDEGTTVYTDGKSLYFNFQRPLQASNDPRAMVKRYFKQISFADPQHASAGKAINVPGDVIAADGTTIYTRDWVWEDQDARTLVARLIVDDDLAYLQASRVFNMRSVSAVELDGAGHMLVSSDPAYSRYIPVVTSSTMQPQHKLSILDAKTLEVSGETDVDTWATFQDALNGRALFSVSGGLLVVNVSDPTKPAAQAYFPTLAWPGQIYFDGHEAMFAGGPYGMYRFNTDVFNLLMH